jgi:hypothetical protein
MYATAAGIGTVRSYVESCPTWRGARAGLCWFCHCGFIADWSGTGACLDLFCHFCIWAGRRRKCSVGRSSVLIVAIM